MKKQFLGYILFSILSGGLPDIIMDIDGDRDRKIIHSLVNKDIITLKSDEYFHIKIVIEI